MTRIRFFFFSSSVCCLMAEACVRDLLLLFAGLWTSVLQGLCRHWHGRHVWRKEMRGVPRKKIQPKVNLFRFEKENPKFFYSSLNFDELIDHSIILFGLMEWFNIVIIWTIKLLILFFIIKIKLELLQHYLTLAHQDLISMTLKHSS